MTAIFVLTLIIIGLGWIGTIIRVMTNLSSCPGSDEGLYIVALIFKTILTAILVVFVSILYAY